MSRWLSPHPDGWDVKPEVPGDLASRPSLATIVVNPEGSFSFSFSFPHEYFSLCTIPDL